MLILESARALPWWSVSVKTVTCCAASNTVQMQRDASKPTEGKKRKKYTFTIGSDV